MILGLEFCTIHWGKLQIVFKLTIIIIIIVGSGGVVGGGEGGLFAGDKYSYK